MESFTPYLTAERRYLAYRNATHLAGVYLAVKAHCIAHPFTWTRTGTIAKEINLPPSTTRRHITQLVKLKALRREKVRGRYELHLLIPQAIQDWTERDILRREVRSNLSGIEIHKGASQTHAPP